MKTKILSILTALFAFVAICSAQNVINASWNVASDTNVVTYSLYYRALPTSTFSVTNISGRLNTSIVLAAAPYTLYELYLTSQEANGIPSAPSNKIHVESQYVGGNGVATSLTLLDDNNANFASFLLTVPAVNGTVTGTPPSIVYTSNNSAVKDMIAYKSPETFSGQNVTNYYTLYDEVANTPPTIIVSP